MGHLVSERLGNQPDGDAAPFLVESMVVTTSRGRREVVPPRDVPALRPKTVLHRVREEELWTRS